MTAFFALWLVGQAISVLLVWRFTWQLGRPALLEKAPRVVIVVAVKGHTVEFDEFLEILFMQDYPNYRVIFAVEADRDPVVATIEKRFAADPERVKLIVAGLSIDEGQKVTNLRAALAATAPIDEILVLADADILPERDWLRRLIEPINRGEADVVTAYPWIVVQDRRLSTLVLASIFAGIAILPRLTCLNAASGSSIAMRREQFGALRILDAWRGAISDDLQLTSVVKRAKKSIVLPRELLLRTPTTTRGFVDVINQAQRWYMLVRIYLPGTYAFAAAVATFIAAGWICATFAVLVGRADGAITLVLGVVLAVLRTLGHAIIVMRLWGKAGLAENRRFLLANPLVTPLATMVNAALVWSSLLRHQTTWAGTTYEVRGPQETKVLSRTCAQRSRRHET
jgi:glycosyltransferase involved in cell wall biosynthesis